MIADSISSSVGSIPRNVDQFEMTFSGVVTSSAKSIRRAGTSGCSSMKLLAMLRATIAASVSHSLVGAGKPLTAMPVASVLQRLDGGFDWAIDGDDAQRITDAGVQVLRESTQMRVLAAGHRLVTVGFGLSRYDPGLQLLGELFVSHRWIDRRETHRFLAKLRQTNGFAATSRFVATEFVAHVNAEVMHHHRDTRRAGAVWTENGEEWRVGMVGVLGVVEESCLTSTCGRRCLISSAVGRPSSDRARKPRPIPSRRSCLGPVPGTDAESIRPR